MPTLDDIGSFADCVQESHQDFRVDTRIYTDQWIFDQEMIRIFERTWVYVGHISEIENFGDYKTAQIGQNPIIVSRSEDGQIHVLLNECRHRGNAVCREFSGNLKNFTCPYHGWAYGLDGSLKGVTHPQGYPENFAAELGGLIELRSGVFRGLIFANMCDDGPDLMEHLGDVAKYVDLWADLSPEPEHRLAKPHHYSFQGNWKFQAENGTDGWHARFTHGSAFETAADFGGPPTTARSTVGCTRGFHHGFGILERPGIRQGLTDDQNDVFRAAIAKRHNPDRLEPIWTERKIFLFPNMTLFDNLIRVIQPIAADQTIVQSYPLLPHGLPDALNRIRIPELHTRLSTAGMINTDDLEMFTSNQTGMRGSKMQWIVLAHGMAEEQKLEGSERLASDTSETPQRAIYQEWARLMGDGDAP